MDGGEYHHFGLDTAGGLFRPLNNSQDFLMKIKFLAQASLFLEQTVKRFSEKLHVKVSKLKKGHRLLHLHYDALVAQIGHSEQYRKVVTEKCTLS